MKKLAQHIKPLALFLTFLLAFAVTGKSLHYVFSDCDHSISVHASDHDTDHISISVESDYATCDLFEFTNQTTTLVQAPSLVTLELPVEPLVQEVVYDQVVFQQYNHCFSLRGPPSLS